MPFLTLLTTIPTASLDWVKLVDRQGADLRARHQPVVPEGTDLCILPIKHGSQGLS